MDRSFFRRMKVSLDSMPESAYIFLCAVLNICLAMLFAGLFLLFAFLDGGQENLWLLSIALMLVKDPAGVLLAGLIGFSFILDRTI